MRYIIKNLKNSKEFLIVTEMFINQENNLEWGLKTTRDMKRHYWRIRGDFYVAKEDDIKSKHIQFRINLNDEGAVMGTDNTPKLNIAITKFQICLSNNECYYEKKSGGVFINDERKEIKYGGWLELKIKSKGKKKLVSLINRDENNKS